MSYDMNIADESFNLTYNVAPMLYKHNEEGIRFIYDKSGSEALPLLLDMFNYFINNKIELEKLNPENGWGSWESTTSCLYKMIIASTYNPNDIWLGD